MELVSGKTYLSVSANRLQLFMVDYFQGEDDVACQAITADGKPFGLFWLKRQQFIESIEVRAVRDLERYVEVVYPPLYTVDGAKNLEKE